MPIRFLGIEKGVMMNIGLISRQVLQPARINEADRPALSQEAGETWTYRDLGDHVARYANGLRGLSVGYGDRVGLLMANSLDYWASYLAAGTIGAISVRLNWRLTAEELLYALQDSGTSMVLAHDRFASVFPMITAAGIRVVLVDDPDNGQAPVPGYLRAAGFTDVSEPAEVDIDASDPCMLMYTSGTTGRPKGAVWTHANTMWFAAMQTMRWKYDHSTVTMSTGPLFHVGSMEDHVLPTLVAGGHGIISRSGSFTVDRATEIIAHHKVTDSLIYPFMIYSLLSDPDMHAERLASLRTMTTGGSPIAPWAVRALTERFPHIALEQVYGLTEGGGISTVMPAGELGRHPGSAGKPLPLTEVRIIDLGDPDRQVSSGEDGEICVRSPSVSPFYWQQPEESAKTFIHGWCLTGDIGHLSEDGFLYITGRIKDMIISGGENIYPAELEAILSDMPGIRDVAIVGVPDPKFQETVCAIVVADGSAQISEDDVIAYSRTRLAGYKRPHYVAFVDELPRNPSGKLLKRELKEQHRHLGEQAEPAPTTKTTATRTTP